MPAPLRNRHRDNYVPLRVFAFPLLDKRLVEWAKRYKISSETDDWVLKQYAWKETKHRRPQKGWYRSAYVYYGDHCEDPKAGLAMMIASNRLTEKMAQSYNNDLIQQYRDLLGITPGWFRKFH